VNRMKQYIAASFFDSLDEMEKEATFE
jgi:hypothetical protein